MSEPKTCRTTTLRAKSALITQMVTRSFVVLHFVCMILLFIVCWKTCYSGVAEGVADAYDKVLTVTYSLLLFAMSKVYGSYRIGFNRVAMVVYSQFIANLVSWGITYVVVCVLMQKLINPLMGFGYLALQLVVSAVWAVWVNRKYFQLHASKRAVVFYRNEADLQKLQEMCHFESRWMIARKVKCVETGELERIETDVTEDAMLRLQGDAELEDTTVVSGDIFEIIKIINQYDSVFVAGISATLRNGILKHCVETNRECYFVPHTGDVLVTSAEPVQEFSVPLFRVCRARIAVEYLALKRTIDIVFSLAALILMAPFMVITAIAIKMHDGGPVLYKQVRLTKDGKEFVILKFRSMRTDSERDGVARLASENDDRITPVGKIIRAVRFDELPQLINILKGDMSIVGPRPERPEIAAQYEKELPAFNLRLQVKAGLTGYAQVYGRYNSEPADKLKMDLMYINNVGLKEDLSLIFATIKILFVKESTQGVEGGKVTAMGAVNVARQKESA